MPHAFHPAWYDEMHPQAQKWLGRLPAIADNLSSAPAAPAIIARTPRWMEEREPAPRESRQTEPRSG